MTERKLKSSNKLSDIKIDKNDTFIEVTVYAEDETFKTVYIYSKHLSKSYNMIADVKAILDKYKGRTIDRVSLDELTCTGNYPNGGVAVRLHLCAGKKMKNGEVIKEYKKETVCLHEGKYLASVRKNRIITFCP